jgi:hypothetical protein
MMTTKKAIVHAAVATVMLVGGVASGETRYVDDDAPGDPGPGVPTLSDPAEDGSVAHPFDAIQEAIDASVDGDEIVVLAGTYVGVGNVNLDFGGRAITLRSARGADSTIIDCEESGRAFHFRSGETAQTRVEGFTITRGGLDGGGMLIEGSSPTVVHCRFVENRPDKGEARGAAVRIVGGSPSFSDCVFLANGVVYLGNGADGGAVHVDGDAMFSRCWFGENAAYGGCSGLGGAIYHAAGTLIVTDSTFAENEAIGGSCAGNGVGRGGAVYSDGGTMLLLNCVLFANRADAGFSPPGKGVIEGGGVYVGGSDARLVNCTLVANDTGPCDSFECTKIGRGGGVFGSAEITNCIFWGNRDGLGGPSAQISGASAVNFSNIEDWDGSLGGQGNISSDPLFLGGTDFRIGAGSPSIDAGNNFALPEWVTVDLDGGDRFVDDPNTADTGLGEPPMVDMGAFEFAPVCDQPGDVNADGAISLGDLLIVLSSWGTCSPDCPADIDRDGIVGLEDLQIVLAGWGCR